MRRIHTYGFGIIALSAAEGWCVEIQGSIYISSDYRGDQNADYTASEGNAIKQRGDIIFIAATMVDDLFSIHENSVGRCG